MIQNHLCYRYTSGDRCPTYITTTTELPVGFGTLPDAFKWSLREVARVCCLGNDVKRSRTRISDCSILAPEISYFPNNPRLLSFANHFLLCLVAFVARSRHVFPRM